MKTFCYVKSFDGVSWHGPAVAMSRKAYENYYLSDRRIVYTGGGYYKITTPTYTVCEGLTGQDVREYFEGLYSDESEED